MFLLFSPFTFLFFTLYVAFLLSLFSISSVLNFWLLIEFSTLLFLGVAYTVFLTSVSSLMLYFFVQAVASFSIIVAFLYAQPEFLLFGILLKLGMFPFITWYVASLSLFPSPVLLLAITFQKLPPLLILTILPVAPPYSILLGSLFATSLVAGSLMFSSSSFRLLLISSSVGNNSWMMLGISSSFVAFMSFFLVYSLLLFSLFTMFNSLVKLPSHSPSMLLIVVSLSGLPPSPLFLSNILIIFIAYPLANSLFLVIFLVLSSISAISYVSFCLRLFAFNLRV